MSKFQKTNLLKTSKENLDPKLTQQVFISKNVMVVYYVYEPGLEFPDHTHPQEQVTIIQKGKLLVTIDGEEMKLIQGDICAIPPNVIHSSKVIGNSRVETISIFTPVSDRVVIQK